MSSKFADFVDDYVIPAILFALMVMGVLGIAWLLIYAFHSSLQEYPTLFEQRDAFVVECMASERYSREDCIIMSGVWNP